MKRLSEVCVMLALADLVSASPAHAQDATWHGATGDFNLAGNWLPAAVPTGTAFFGSMGSPDIQVSASTALGGLTFTSGAQAFTFGSTSQSAGLTLGGAGVANSSPTAPHFRISNSGAVASLPGLTFLNAASAANAIIANVDGGVTGFLGTSTAGTATIANTAGSALLSGTAFIGSSTAGDASITNNTGGITQFNPSASAGRAAIVNKGTSIEGFSIARFINALTNPAAVPMASSVGATAFVGTATAAAASIVNSDGGVTAFLGASTADSATIVTNAGGATFLTGESTGGTARLIVNAGGTLDLSAHAPGNIAAGSFTAAAGSTYRIGVSASGQGTSLALSGAATLKGGTVDLVPLSTPYVPNTTITILTAAQGVTGTFSGTSHDFAFLTPTLGYDANEVHLSLLLLPGAFRSSGQTPNQQAVGGALDARAVTGNYGGLVTTLSNLDAGQGAPALQALSGEPYADLGTLNTRAGQLFMNAVGRQIAAGRAAGPGTAQNVARAETCDGSCNARAPRPYGAWISAIGGTGVVAGDSNAAGLTHSFGGLAFGIDHRVDPRLLVGLAGGYVSGTQWVNGFAGSSASDVLNIALYSSFTSGDFYVDALAGYANASNRLQRIISSPGLPTGIANGNTSANQFLGQIETGYQIGLGLPARMSVAPFARFQIASSDRAGFTEAGASLYNLAVASRATTSARGTLGVDLVARLDPGRGSSLDVGLRLGWVHEYADTSRLMTAAFAAAPSAQFTVFGATPRRDAAMLGVSAVAALSASTAAFLGYDGEFGGGTNNHALRAGLRLSW